MLHDDKKKLPPLTEDQSRMLEQNIRLAASYVAEWRRRLPSLRRMPYDDVLQQAALGLAEAIQRYDPSKSRLSTYSRFHMRSALQNLLRYRTTVTAPLSSQLAEESQRKASVARTPPAGDSALRSLVAPCSEDHAASLAEQDALEVALAELPGRLRYIVRMRFWKGATLREIGEQLGVSRNRVAQLEERALRLMRESLGKEAA